MHYHSNVHVIIYAESRMHTRNIRSMNNINFINLICQQTKEIPPSPSLGYETVTFNA